MGQHREQFPLALFGRNDRLAWYLAKLARQPHQRHLFGLDVHIGSQLTDLEPYRLAYGKVAELTETLRADGALIVGPDDGAMACGEFLASWRHNHNSSIYLPRTLVEIMAASAMARFRIPVRKSIFSTFCPNTTTLPSGIRFNTT